MTHDRDLEQSHVPAKAYVWWCVIVIALGAFLLFQVQPIISKMILPQFGGSPGVWTACLLFFQMVLLAGYAYAHCLARVARPFWQVCIHASLIAAALFVLPLAADSVSTPLPSAAPVWQILGLLTVHVGLPYFVLAATSPLVQVWYSRSLSGRLPYRFYAVSNAGSLAALVSYPLLIEATLPLAIQAHVWSVSFIVFAAACMALGVYTHWRRTDSPNPPEPLNARTGRRPSGWDRLSWIVFPALATIMLLGTTQHICQDVAVVPLLWVVPLSLYLISFMVCFGREGLYRRGWVGGAVVVLVLLLSLLTVGADVRLAARQVGVDVQLPDLSQNIGLEVLLYLAALAAGCLLCHGEVARRRPTVGHLTAFYLTLAAGGAAGGVFVALVSPVLFSALVEVRLALLAIYLLGVYVLIEAGRGLRPARQRWFRWATVSAIVASTLCVAYGQRAGRIASTIHASRNFYGVLAVSERDVDLVKHLRTLYHGRIMHGAQMMRPELRKIPTTYFTFDSGVGIAIRAMRETRRAGDAKAEPLRIGAVGLGVGTMAAHGRDGDVLRFYEIDPNVVDIARRYFTFLGDSAADVEVIIGDARITMQSEEPQRYDVLVLDAFSGDAPPLHLLTQEAFGVYRKHMREDAVVAVHTTNRYVDYTRAMASLAKTLGLHALHVSIEDNRGFAGASSDWVLITGGHDFREHPLIRERAVDITDSGASVRTWTDQYSSLLPVLSR